MNLIFIQLYVLDQTVQIPNPLSLEQRDEVLEKLKDRLEKSLKEQESTSLANRQLENEVKELQALVKEYEAGLEVVTDKLRAHAVKFKRELLLR